MRNQHETDFPTTEYLRINSCGSITHITMDSHINREYRNDYQLLYVAEGKISVKVKDELLWANKGDIVFFRPNEPQIYSLYEKFQSSTYWVHFGGEGADALVKSLMLEEKTVYTLAHKREIEEHMHRLVESFLVAKPHYRMQCNGILLGVLSLFGRYASQKEETSNVQNRSSQIINELISNFRTYGLWMSVKDCSKECNLSPAHFSRLFKQVTGENPVKFFSNIRIEYAKHLLTYTDYPVSRVSEMSGHKDQNYFARIFKKNTGMTPLQFRRK